MNEKESELLIKLLNLTTSPFDAEALSATRKMNQLIRNFNLSWESIVKDFRSKSTKNSDSNKKSESNTSYWLWKSENDQSIDWLEVFNLIEKWGYHSNFIDSVFSFFSSYEYLSDKQKKVLFEIFSKLRSKQKKDHFDE